MKNQHRNKQRVFESNQQDYISKLPNSILCNILSFLKVKEAVKTSVLSSKWRHTYANPTNLVLDADNMLKGEYTDPNIFLRNVNQYLSRVKNVQKIDKLKVCSTFSHNNGYTDLDEWIRFATKRNVEEVDLCLLEENQPIGTSNYGTLYVFPCDIVGNEGASASGKSFLKCLRLAHCVLAPHKYHNSGFSKLTTLELLKVDLKAEVHVHILLSSCNNLEWLAFSKCYKFECLKIEHQKLKYLNVNLCAQLKALVIHSTSLETLEYKGCRIKFEFVAPRLKTFFSRVSDSTACHREVWPFFSLSVDLPQMESLMLECSCQMGEVMTNRLPTFPSLRHLEVIKVAVKRQDLRWVAKILNACPMLGRLELHLRTYVCIDEELREINFPPRCLHNHLKEVTITGVRGHSSEIAIAIYLLNNAIALEKMTVDPRGRNYLGNGKWYHSEAENWSTEVRQKIHKHLEQQASSAVELLIK
ncbi:putative FBD-associated F-box protein At5g22720 [Abrus precatorius]|uniref:FBD-associated F-box protein At5g22720 n=1 Tax=Abrus precatorius TaxID=3816 RepID=A0A8B8KXS4_ABRPR|nr:putative FBD-associated F-box protein At5g22720 [Abrus precatorius]